MMEGFSFSLLGFLGFHFQERQESQNEKMVFAKALIKAQEEERKRMSGGLDHGVEHHLSLIKKEVAEIHKTALINQEKISLLLKEVRFISRNKKY